jgi:nicotinate-nucleotide adenylyltransferase
MEIGLFFGSFNPIHIGHLAIAEAVKENSPLKQIWFVPSPHNPLKTKSSLLHAEDRYEMVRIAIEDNPDFRVTDIEFYLPQPNYTYVTLQKLKEKYPQHDFSVIIGEDNLQNFTKWKNYEEILENYKLYVNPRPNSQKTPLHTHPNVHVLSAQPQLEISATYIRDCIKSGKSIRYLVPENVLGLIKLKKFYT